MNIYNAALLNRMNEWREPWMKYVVIFYSLTSCTKRHSGLPLALGRTLRTPVQTYSLMADLGLKASLQQISVSVGNVGAVCTDTHLHTHRLCCTRYPVYLSCRISHLSSHTSVVQLLRIAACCFKPSTTPASTFRLWRMCTHHSPISMCIIFVGRNELWAQKPN